MKKICWLVCCVCLSYVSTAQNLSNDVYRFKVNLNKVVDDKIEVELTVPETIRKEKKLKYHLPKIVPGTYSVYNFGRFVTKFKVYDKKGKALKNKYIKHPDANTWLITKPKKVYKITYTVEDTWDTDKDRAEDFIFEPGGTNIEDGNNFVLNNHGFFGYFDGFKRRDFYVTVDRPTNFFGATSLKRTDGDEDTDVFYAPNYMDLADAPMMFSPPDTAIIKVGNADVLVATYSKNKKITSEFIAGEVAPILQAQKAYLGGTLPVDRYVFIIYLTDKNPKSGKWGALEHSYSSFYFLPEMKPERIAQSIRDVAAHEFFHIVTPLNIHSEEIHNFDFINPKMSMHLWLYEGVTEYSAGHVQVKEGLMPIEKYLKVVEGKIRNAATFKDYVPFTTMSSFVLSKYKDQYANVYEKGALIGLCLDIKLRSLSGGQKGLQLLIQELSKEFGKNKAFKDDELFDIITKLSYPEIGQFLKTYISGPEPLPIEELLAQTGIKYFPEKEVQDISPLMGDINKYLGFDGTKFFIKSETALDAFGRDIMGLRKGDVLTKWNGKELNLQSINMVLGMYMGNVKEGDELVLTVKRKGLDTQLKGKITPIPVMKKHIIELAADATPEQIELRKAWLGDYKMKENMEETIENDKK